jgi:CheY-like chemotaxis protein
MDGFEVCCRLKSEPRTQHIAVIMVTALDQPTRPGQGLEAGAVRCNIRGIDLACTLGGEEFVVVMPDTDLAKAYLVGERLRQCIVAAAPFYAGERIGTLEVTASVGAFPLSNLPTSSNVPIRCFTAPSAMGAQSGCGRRRLEARLWLPADRITRGESVGGGSENGRLADLTWRLSV